MSGRANNTFIELTPQNPEHWISVDSLQAGWFEAHTYWVGGGDLDQIVAWRGIGGTCGIVAPKEGRTGSRSEPPYIYQENDDHHGGMGERVRGDVFGAMSAVKKLCIGVYNNDVRMPLSRSSKLATAIIFPELPPVVVRMPNIDTSACTIMQVDFAPNGIAVLYDVVAINPLVAPSSLEALVSYWVNPMWGQLK